MGRLHGGHVGDDDTLVLGGGEQQRAAVVERQRPARLFVVRQRVQQLVLFNRILVPDGFHQHTSVSVEK